MSPQRAILGIWINLGNASVGRIQSREHSKNGESVAGHCESECRKKDFFPASKTNRSQRKWSCNAHAETWFCMMLAWHPERPQISSGYDIISVGSHIH